MQLSRTVLSAGVLLGALCLPAPAGVDQEIADTYIRQMAEFVAIAREDMDPAQPGVCHPEFPDDHFQTPGYVMAFLYKTAHPLNPYYGKTEIRDTAIAIADHTAASRTTLEWSLYSVCQTAELLADELGEERMREYEAYARHYVSIRGNRPYMYTSFNHDTWNALAVLRAGQVFGQPEWVELGGRLMRQMLKIQTKLGYYDEGPHHGPSLKYNQVQLAPMLLFYDYTKQKDVLAAAKRLADFMIRYSFPDGTPMSTFDGRQNYFVGYYSPLAYGLDRWPEGKQIMHRLFETHRRRDMLDLRKPWYNLSDFYGYFGSGFLVDEYRALRAGAPAAPLPQDRDGYVLVEKAKTFNGGYLRKHDWVVAVSGIVSDVPVLQDSPYRMTRQSRLDIWHKKTGLLIGGGSTRNHVETPLANFVLVTGYKDVDCEFGRIFGGSLLDRQALYFPRNAAVSFSEAGPVLEENYGQGDVGFSVRPLSKTKLAIDYQYDVFQLKKLFVQLPLIVFEGSRLRVDGEELAAGASARVRRGIELEDPAMGTRVRLTVPEGEEVVIREPVPPLRWYHEDFGQREQRWKPVYHIRLVSLRLSPPLGKGNGEFLLEIVD